MAMRGWLQANRQPNVRQSQQDLCDLAIKFAGEQVAAKADQPGGISAALEG